MNKHLLGYITLKKGTFLTKGKKKSTDIHSVKRFILKINSMITQKFLTATLVMDI